MKMADSPLLSSVACDSNNKNCVEDATKEENGESDINNRTTAAAAATDDSYCCDISTQEEAVEEFLAGDGKPDDLMSNIGEDTEDEVLFKTENLLGCGEGAEGYAQKDEDEEEEAKQDGEDVPAKNSNTVLDQCLNKMQIMEDVREGCNVQPSSPGHANQVGDVQVKTEDEETEEENGLDEQKRPEEKLDVKEETKDSRGDAETLEDQKEEAADENYSNSSSPSGENGGSKRKSDNEEPPVKRLRAEIHENFFSRDKILNEFIEMADCNSLDQIQTFSEQLLAEVKTLNELAKEKEREWNNIIHLKKLKEELLIRMQRKKHVLLINEKSDLSEFLNESHADTQDSTFSQSILKTNLLSKSSRASNVNGERLKHKTLLNKTNIDMNGSLDFRQRQRPTLDVQSIIADYRQRHPETVPRRGRRIRTSQNDGSNRTVTGNIINFSSMALGSGAQVRHNVQTGDISNELGLLLNTINTTRTEGTKAQNDQDPVSFKDMLQQFVKLSQSERNELIQNAFKPPPPYPEVTVLPVPATTAAPTSSLLHGILTKAPSKQNSKTSFSPTLARLLTAPERASNSHHAASSPVAGSPTIQASNMSISEILSTSKARNEITITPVDSQYESSSKGGGRSMDDEEAEDSADRLVIDESNEAMDARKSANNDNSSDNGDDIPQCQGCNQKPAQFVCAGCGNQWYCSRDCQVSAWDEHSEVCSG